MNWSPALQRLKDSVRCVYQESLTDQQRWDEVAQLLAIELADQDLAAQSRDWPTSHDRMNKRYTNLLFYEDTDSGFVINGLVKDETGRTPIHDHGHAWVAYGLLEGAETIIRYKDAKQEGSGDNLSLDLDEEFSLQAGQVDLVPPWTFHAEQADTDRTVAIMVRSARVGLFAHRRFDPSSGTIYDHPGPVQIPFSR